MSTKPTTVKRQREEQEQNEHNDPNQEESKEQEPPRKKRKISLSAQLNELSEYKCCICFDLPQNQINQCSSGHIICSDCYPQINDSKCPQCRIKINMSNPIRNRLAEKTLSSKPMHCDNDGCSRTIIFAKMKDHKENQCGYKPTECKFKGIGCEWKGFRKDVENHERNCTLDQNKILQIVNQINKEKQLLEQREWARETLLYMTTHSSAVYQEAVKPNYNENATFNSTSVFSEHDLNVFGVNVSAKYAICLKCEVNRNGDYVMYWSVGASLEIEQIGIAIFQASNHRNINECLISSPRDVPCLEWIPFDNILPAQTHQRRFNDYLYVKVFMFWDDQE